MAPKKVKAVGNGVARSNAVNNNASKVVVEDNLKSNGFQPSESDPSLKNIDIQYNPDIVDSFLKELKKRTETRCIEIEAETEFLVTALRQSFYIEMMKFPKQIKDMPLKKFKEEYNMNLDSLLSNPVSKPFTGPAPPLRTMNPPSNNNHIFQTPAQKKAPMTQLRNPREGEVILSVNGSPLGEFRTVQKPANTARSNILPPPTPGVYVPLPTGDIVDVASIDVENLPPELRTEALHKVQNMMENMKAIMEKLQSTESSQQHC